jgi:hypothetical protein
MLGMAVPTIVVSSAASAMPSINAIVMIIFACLVIPVTSVKIDQCDMCIVTKYITADDDEGIVRSKLSLRHCQREDVVDYIPTLI